MLTKELIKKKHPGKKLEKMKYLNLWGEDIENIDIISEMKSLKLINLSANKISSLKPLENLAQLKEVYLRQNNISDLNQINYLSNCHHLKSLWLTGNPICKNSDEFLKAITEKLPNLTSLDNKPIAQLKKDLDNKNYDIDENIILEDKKEPEKENDIVVQGEITKNNFYVNNNDNKEKEKNETEKENENNKEVKKIEENTNKEKDQDKNDIILDDLLYNLEENTEKKEDENKNELKQTKNKLLVSTVDKLHDLLLDNDKEESTNVNEDKSNNLNDKTNFLDSKSDIFKTGFTYKRNEDENKENKQDQNDNNNENNDNNDLNKGKDIHNPLRLASFKEENNELLNNILKNVDTSQSFIRKTNTNKTIKITPNMVEANGKNNINNNDVNNNINNDINNIIDNKNDNNNNIIKTNNNDDNSFTKNLNDMIKNANMDISSQSFRLGKNTGLTNILNNINTSQTMPRKIENNVSNILREINTSQTMNKRKDQQVNDILKDVETTTTNFNKGNIDMNDINNLEKNNANPNFQSIDDIKKMFNNDYPRNNDNNNLYGNNNIKDTRINEIFKNEKITSDSMLPSNNKDKGPVKIEYDNNFINKNYECDYDKRLDTDNGQNDGNGGNKKNYNLNPRHENKINAIINLLEDLNLENLLHIKNQIVKMMKSNK